MHQKTIESPPTYVFNNQAANVFIGMLAHEIRTQIAGVCTASTMLLQEPENRNREIYLSHINMIGHDVLHVLNNMMSTAIIGESQFQIYPRSEKLPLREWLNGQLMQYDLAMVPKSIQFNVEIQGTVPDIIITDGTKLWQILKNLINNALKYAPPYSTISIIIRLLNTSQLNFSITDQGPGIPADKVPLLFQRFQAIDQGMAGNGLGLYISKQLAYYLGGDLLLESTGNTGTTFLLTIRTNLQD